ncbi:MAG TPA: fibronectin type III domain-containing protein, partial [Thermoanaerobaculia bacterium]|nr:fibronectin type III domain-containing protein [Thermoanaerobaculia bacterium]
LAIGGPFFSCTKSTHQGAQFRPAVRAFVTTQDGAGSYFAGNGGKNGEEVFAHELGHTLGLGHSGVNGALMRSFAYGDGRGASLGGDDRAAIAYLYGSGGGGPAPPVTVPAAPSGLTVVPLSEVRMRLSWNDNSDDEDSFRVEVLDGIAFDDLGSVAAGTRSVNVSNLEPGTTYTFRIRACRGDACSPYSNQASAATHGSGSGGNAQPPAAPSNLSATVSSATEVALSWRDNASDEQGYHLEMREAGGSYGEIATIAADNSQAMVTGLDPESEYTFRVRARNAGGFSSYSNPASARTPEGEPPACRGSNVLCLFGGRFSISVTWRDQRSGEVGVGTAIPGADRSGYFWFFNQDNVELVVKVLDGRAVNGSFWVFYGGLSDVQYEITVRDEATGQVRRYENAAGDVCGNGDTGAFAVGAATAPLTVVEAPPHPAAPGPVLESGESLVVDDFDLGFAAGEAVAQSGTCTPGDQVLCLQDGRFEVSATWRNHRAANEFGVGHASPSDSGGEKTGFLWFFAPENIELVVKMIDGRAVNGHWWFFYGGLSDVDYTIRVRDTVAGKVKSYRNAPGEICGRGDTGAF